MELQISSSEIDSYSGSKDMALRISWMYALFHKQSAAVTLNIRIVETPNSPLFSTITFADKSCDVRVSFYGEERDEWLLKRFVNHLQLEITGVDFTKALFGGSFL